MTRLNDSLSARLAAPRWSESRFYASELRPGWAKVEGRDCLVLCSNDYLGLAGDPRVVEASAAAGRRFGFGVRAARTFLGDTSVHRELEAMLARLKGAEAALLFSSGFACNLGVLGALSSVGDLIASDELNHASIVDGARLSRADVCVHRHGDVSDLVRHLDRHSEANRVLIVTESVFSMDGDLAPLGEIVEVARQCDGVVILDEAHATGVLGAAGEGLVAELGLHGQVEVVTGTLGKALGSVGGFVAGSRGLIDFLAERARTFLFDTALPVPAAAAALEAVTIMAAEPERVSTLRRHVSRLHTGLLECGYRVVRADSAILPVEFDNPLAAQSVCDSLRGDGVVAIPVGPPHVRAGTSRIRVQPCAAHTDAEVDRVLEAFAAARVARHR